MSKALWPNPKRMNPRPYKFQVVDLEARNWINFIVGGYYDGKTYEEFRDLRHFIYKLKNSRKKLNVFAHFGGGYDFLFIIKAAIEESLNIETITLRGSLILNIKIIGKYKTHYLRDSGALLPFSLDTLSKNFNVETRKGTYDHTLNRDYNPELSAYLKSDCLALYQVLEKFYNSKMIREAGPATTIAAQAQKILATYLKEQIYAPNDKQNAFMRDACHGGRTEIFKPIGQNLREYDANGLYQYVMKINDFPQGYAWPTNEYEKGYLGIYKVKVKVPKNTLIPCIPFKSDKKLIFPAGEFITTITSAEFDYAQGLGYKFKVISGLYFKSKYPYFKEFITDLYKIRENTAKDSVDNVLSKLIGNSSYGKFLMKLDRTNLTFKQTTTSRLYKDIPFKNGVIELLEDDVKLDSFIHCGIGAFILAYARIHMHKFMTPIQEHVFYTDTDSIWTDKILNHSNKLGDLKLELPKNSAQEFYDKACFLLPKTYIAETKTSKKIAMKGFNKRKIMHLNFRDFSDALIGENNLKIKHDSSIARLKTSLKRDTFLSLKNEFTKEIRTKYNKRVLNLKNNTSKPITLKL